MREKSTLKLKKLKSFGLATGIPMIMLGAPLIGYGIGVGVDSVLKSHPYGKFSCLFLGIISGIFEVVKIIKKLNKEEDDTL